MTDRPGQPAQDFQHDLDTALDKVDGLLVRSRDLLAACRLMADKVDRPFRPVVDRFVDCHAGHVDWLSTLLEATDHALSDGASLREYVSRAVVTLRARLAEADQTLLLRIRDLEKPLLAAFDDAQDDARLEPLHSALRAMSRELRALLSQTEPPVQASE